MNIVKFLRSPILYATCERLPSVYRKLADLNETSDSSPANQISCIKPFFTELEKAETFLHYQIQFKPNLNEKTIAYKFK